MTRAGSAELHREAPANPAEPLGRTSETYGILLNAEKYHGTRGDTFGLTQQQNGYNFAIHASGDAKDVDFCYYDPGSGNIIRWALEPSEQTPEGAKIFTGFIPGLQPNDLYTVRVDRDNPASYNVNLLDPYAKAITRLGQPDSPDSPAYCVATGPECDIPMVEKPVIDQSQLVIYEAHIANSTAQNPDIPAELRGTYLGFVHPANLEHLKKLGITAVEIEPPMQFFSEPMLGERGMVNDWGYNTIGFHAPHEGYATQPGEQVREWKLMVNALHEAGIAVIADVVYNHTADGPIRYTNHDGKQVDSPTYSLRGLDDDGYYRRKFVGADGVEYYEDTTGCGNNIDTAKPAAAKLVRDSLVYWVTEMGVDGARFDLAPSVGGAEFFTSLKNDPALKDCLMIAEPWSWGCGYPKGSYGEAGLPEWNGEFRDTVRDFWRGRESLGKLAYVMAGSFNPDGVVNFVTAHDGFSLKDLVTYNDKHNWQNGEQNRDGADDNRSYNHGVEGPTDDPAINELRRKTMHNFIHTLLMSRGIVMMLGGDEVGRTQNGNNNAYCRAIEATGDDNPYAKNWQMTPEAQSMFNTYAGAIELRKSSTLGVHDANISKIADSPIDERGLDWFNLWGTRMNNGDWQGKVMGLFASGRAGSNDADTYLTYVNGYESDVQVSLPHVPGAAGDYVLVSDSSTGEIDPEGIKIMPSTFALGAMSSVILRRISSRLPEAQLSAQPNYPQLEFPILTGVVHV